MPNPASALGEAVGHLIEAGVQNIIRATVEHLGYFVDTGGKRPGVRKGTKLMLVNDTDNEKNWSFTLSKQRRLRPKT
ncbi:MAG: hypothetical protein HY796_09085 [Elusimicrobia bacterium]|nr:hypothetical protein [Elusimicrobiota bacterium]